MSAYKTKRIISKGVMELLGLDIEDIDFRYCDLLYREKHAGWDIIEKQMVIDGHDLNEHTLREDLRVHYSDSCWSTCCTDWIAGSDYDTDKNDNLVITIWYDIDMIKGHICWKDDHDGACNCD